MIRSNSPLDQFIDRTLGGVLRHTDPGRLGWGFVAAAITLGFLGVVKAATSTEELLRYLAMLSFTTSIVFTEPQIPWPPAARKPLAAGMFVVATALALTWMVTTGAPLSFNWMALIFAFAVTIRELKRLIVLI